MRSWRNVIIAGLTICAASFFLPLWLCCVLGFVAGLVFGPDSEKFA
jgi:uncharacterized membrane protein SpoIIM required for sporulation